MFGGFGNLCAADREERKPQAVSDKQTVAGRRKESDVRHGKQCGDHNHPEISGISNPENRMAIEQYVAQGAPADGRQCRQSQAT
jgi:hypothetical protein